MEFEIKAGGKIDLLTKKELHDTLQSWLVEAVRGVQPRRLSAVATIASNAFSVDATNINNVMGPEAGYIWMVRRVAVTGPTVSSDASGIFINRNDATNLVYPLLTGQTGCTGYAHFSRDEFLLRGGETMVVASTGNIAATGVVTVSYAVTEIPVGLLWKVV